MRDEIDIAETRPASVILGDAREMQARHAGSALASFIRALRGAIPAPRGAVAPGQLVLH